MSAPDLLHPAWLGPALALLLATSVGVAAALGLATRRGRRLLGPAATGRASLWSDACLLLALGLVLLGTTGPRWGTETVLVPASGSDVVVLLDVSRSMDARDQPPSRLARAHELADEVLARLAEGDRAALAVYAGRGVLLTPLTPDKQALRAMVPALDSELMQPGGSRLAQGMGAALEAFHTPSLRPRVVLVLGDGEDPERSDDLGARRAGAAGVRVVAVTYGTESGAIVPARGGPLRDVRGREVTSRAHPERLATLARETGGVWLASDEFGRVDAARVVGELRRDGAKRGDGFLERELPVQRSDGLAALALALLLLEGVRLRPRSHRTARAGLAVATAALALPLLGADGGPDAPALLRIGVERAEAGDLARAERAFFAAAVRAHDPATAADAYYDLGVAALGRQDYPTAADAFFDALAIRPGDRRTQWNLEWTLRVLQSVHAGGKGAGSETPPEDRPREEPRKAERNLEEEQDQALPEPRRRPRPEPVMLDPEATRKWLERVEDDPSRALRATTRSGDPGAGGRARPGPRW